MNGILFKKMSYVTYFDYNSLVHFHFLHTPAMKKTDRWLHIVLTVHLNAKIVIKVTVKSVNKQIGYFKCQQ